MAPIKKEAATPELEDVRAQIAAMLAEAKKEAAKIIEEAQAQANAPKATSGMTAEEKAKYDAEMNEYVEVQLFKDNDKYKDPVFVGVNGETIAIERGEKVKIKRKFAMVLENSNVQDYKTSQLIEKKSKSANF